MTTTTAPRTFTKADTRRVFCPGFTLWTVTVPGYALGPMTVAADNADGARSIGRFTASQETGRPMGDFTATAEAIGPNPEAAAWQAAANA